MYKVSRVIALFTFAAMILLPSLIVVLGSFKTDAEVYNKPLSLPENWSLGNYTRLLSDSDLDVSFRNSVFVTVSSVVLTLILASLASFAIARMITVSGKVLAGLFALGLAIPAQINLVPIYYIFRDLGLTNSYIGLILINVTTTLPISIFILSAFFKQVSKEMYEASEVDGASPLRIYRSIALPLSKPAMGATAIFLFVINWNDLLWPLLLIQESEKKTLPLAMLAYRGEYFVSFSMLFTAVMVASLPMVIMYLLAPQRAARIATQLMELIELQKLLPGDKLPPERQLADLLEVSRPSLREALHILQAQGLVQIKHGQGTFVQEPVVAQELRASVMTKTHGLNELFDAREVLEVPASKWAAEKATKEDIRLLRATLNQIDTITAIEPIDFDQLQALDAKFHLTIVGIAGNRFINQTLNVLQDVMKMSMETTLRLPGRSEISRNEHNEILTAIENVNGELASKLTLQHITGARTTALADAKRKDSN